MIPFGGFAESVFLHYGLWRVWIQAFTTALTGSQRGSLRAPSNRGVARTDDMSVACWRTPLRIAGDVPDGEVMIVRGECDGAEHTGRPGAAVRQQPCGPAGTAWSGAFLSCFDCIPYCIEIVERRGMSSPQL
jgi:hypothetical protein